MKKLFLCILCFCIISVSEISAQNSIVPSPDFSYGNENAKVKISSENLTFYKNQNSTCPGKLKVTSSNVTLSQGSPTVPIVASSISLTEGGSSFQATFSIPDNSYGYYNVEINDPQCPAICRSCFSVVKPAISLSQAVTEKNSIDTFYIESNGAVFKKYSSSVCPKEMKIKNTGIEFRNGTTVLHPEIVNVDSSKKMQVILKVPSNAVKGLYDVAVTSAEGNCTINCPGCFTVRATPSVVSSPSESPRNHSLNLILSGSDVTFSQASPTSNCDLGEYALSTSNTIITNGKQAFAPLSIDLTSDTSYQLKTFVPLNISPGYYDIVGDYKSACPLSCNKCLHISGNLTNELPPVLVPKVSFIPVVKTGHSAAIYYSVDGLILTDTGNSICNEYTNINNQNVFLRKGNTIIYPYVGDPNNFYVPANAPIGAYDLVVKHGTCEAVCKECFVVESSAPSISLVLPASAQVPSSLSVTISGNNVEFSQASATTSFSVDKITFSMGGYSFNPAYAYAYGNSLVTQLALDENIFPGVYDISVKYKDTTLVCNSCFTIALKNPAIAVSQNEARGSFSLTGLDGLVFSSKSTRCPFRMHLDPKEIIVSKDGFSMHADSAAVIEATDSSAIQVYYKLPGNAPYGQYDVTVASADTCTYTCQGCLTIGCDDVFRNASISGPQKICYGENRSFLYRLSSAGKSGYWTVDGGTVVSSDSLTASVKWNPDVLYGSIAFHTLVCNENYDISLEVGFIQKQSDIYLIGNFNPCEGTKQRYFIYPVKDHTYSWSAGAAGKYVSFQKYFVWNGNNNIISIMDSSSCGNFIKTFTIHPGIQASLPVIYLDGETNKLYSSSVGGNQWYKGDSLLTGLTQDSLTVGYYKNIGYHVSVLQNCGQSSSEIIQFHEVVTGVEEKQSTIAGSILIFPNPANDNFYMTMSDDANSPDEIRIENMMGEQVLILARPDMKTPINIQSLQAGLYIVNVHVNGEVRKQKLVIGR